MHVHAAAGHLPLHLVVLGLGPADGLASRCERARKGETAAAAAVAAAAAAARWSTARREGVGSESAAGRVAGPPARQVDGPNADTATSWPGDRAGAMSAAATRVPTRPALSQGTPPNTHILTHSFLPLFYTLILLFIFSYSVVEGKESEYTKWEEK